MDKLETELINAVREANIENVRTLLAKGANVNVVPSSGTTPLGIAALLGNVTMMRILLDSGKLNNDSYQTSQEDYYDRHERKQIVHSESSTSPVSCDSKSRQNNSDDTKTNLGYFIVVHDDKTSDNEFPFRPMDVNQNENITLNDPLTPEGMDGLEWDAEVNDSDSEGAQEEEDTWSCQYRWYAYILDKTCCTLMDQSNTCDINLQDLDGRCAIHYAADQGHYEAILFLINSGCRVDVSDVQNFTPLHLAAARDHVDVVELLLSHGAQVNRKTVDKMAPLHFATARGFTEMVKILLHAGAHIDSVDSSERTALHLAVARGHVEVAELLIQRGAKVNIEEIHGYTPLCEAVWRKSVQLAELLLASGAKLTQSHYLLHYAVLHQHLDMAEVLLGAGSIPNLRDDHGDTPLIMAARTGQTRMAELLLQNGASANYPNSVSGTTPLHEAVVCIRESDFSSLDTLVRILRRHDVDLNAISPAGGETPLTRALLSERYKAAALLIKLGADVNKIRAFSNFFTNLSIVWKRDLFSLVQLLVAAGFDLTHSTPELVKPDDFSKLNLETITGWLTYRKFNPPCLSELCRQCIRHHLKDKVSDVVPILNLPKLLQQYLMFQDIYVEEITTNSRGKQLDLSCEESGQFCKYLHVEILVTTLFGPNDNSTWAKKLLSRGLLRGLRIS